MKNIFLSSIINEHHSHNCYCNTDTVNNNAKTINLESLVKRLHSLLRTACVVSFVVCNNVKKLLKMFDVTSVR